MYIYIHMTGKTNLHVCINVIWYLITKVTRISMTFSAISCFRFVIQTVRLSEKYKPIKVPCYFKFWIRISDYRTVWLSNCQTLRNHQPQKTEKSAKLYHSLLVLLCYVDISVNADRILPRMLIWGSFWVSRNRTMESI